MLELFQKFIDLRAIPKIKIKIGRTTMAPKSINF